MALIKCPDCGREVSSEAQACPGCARPVKGPQATAPSPADFKRSREPASPYRQKVSFGQVIMAGVILIGVIWWFSGQSDDQGAASAQQSSPASTPQAVADGDHGAGDEDARAALARAAKTTIDIDAGSLYRLYAANEVAADDRLAGHLIKVSGTVSSIEKDFTGSAMIYFAVPGDEFSHVSATLRDSEKGKAATIMVGQTATVTCDRFRLIMQSPMGDNCTID